MLRGMFRIALGMLVSHVVLACGPRTVPTITIQPADLSVSAGLKATFQVTAVGGELGFQWLRGGSLIAGGTSSSYTSPPVTSADNAAVFSVVVTDAFGGKVTSAPANLTVTPGTFSATKGQLTTARQFHTATRLADGKVLLVGGIGTIEAEDSAELFDPTSGLFTRLGSKLVHARYGHTATLLPDGKVLFAGGSQQNGGPVPTILASAELFDPVTGTFTEIAAPLDEPRTGHTATVLRNGKILLAGGGNYFDVLPKAVVFDPNTQTFTATSPLVTPRGAHAAALLPDGKVLIAGGYVPASGIRLASAEVFDPDTGAFTKTTGSLSVPRYGLVAAQLPGGAVLVAGGMGNPNQAIGTAELFDQGTGTFTLANGHLKIPSDKRTSTLLPSGYVLVVGDYVDSGGELFDSASGTFVPTNGPQITPRHGNTTTLLADGSVLLAGGLKQAALSSAELYW